MLQIRKLKSFVRAVWSLCKLGDSPLPVYNVRTQTCWECPSMKASPTGYFCRACECPEWFLSDLRTKWRIRDLSCPLGKW
jgi:hypothetical protein